MTFADGIKQHKNLMKEILLNEQIHIRVDNGLLPPMSLFVGGQSFLRGRGLLKEVHPLL